MAFKLTAQRDRGVTWEQMQYQIHFNLFQNRTGKSTQLSGTRTCYIRIFDPKKGVKSEARWNLFHRSKLHKPEKGSHAPMNGAEKHKKFCLKALAFTLAKPFSL